MSSHPVVLHTVSFLLFVLIINFAASHQQKLEY